MDTLPETNYALSGDVSIAFQVMPGGDIDLIVLPALISHIEFFHELPGFTQFLRRLSAFARVITFDKRGQGMSDRISSAPSMEERMDDIRAVMEAVGSEKAVLFGHSDGGTVAALFAATYPERVQALILYAGFAKSCSAPDYTFMPSRDERWQRVNGWIDNWGKGFGARSIAPQWAEDEELMALFARAERLTGTPTSMRKYFEAVIDTDIRTILPTISVPTLVLNHSDDQQVPVAAGRHLAESINDAKFVDLGEGGHLFFNGDQVRFAGELAEFLTGSRSIVSVTERILATVMFTDIVSSTEKLGQLGDEKWRTVLDEHDNLTKQLVEVHRGRVIKYTGDGALAIFDGPGRAIQCACGLSERVKSLDIEIRTGLHTGEVEVRDDDISSVAVHLASRIVKEADAKEVLVSRIVCDLVTGSKASKFGDRQEHSFKGFSGDWQVFKATMNRDA